MKRSEVQKRIDNPNIGHDFVSRDELRALLAQLDAAETLLRFYADESRGNNYAAKEYFAQQGETK